MPTVILINKKRTIASTDDANVIKRWKSSLNRSCISCLVLEDGKDEHGRDRYSIEIPRGVGYRSAMLLIPQASESKRQEGLQLISEAKTWLYGGLDCEGISE